MRHIGSRIRVRTKRHVSTNATTTKSERLTSMYIQLVKTNGVRTSMRVMINVMLSTNKQEYT